MQSKEHGHHQDIPKLRLQHVLIIPSTIITVQSIKLVPYRRQQAQNTLFKYREII